jgi:hypothetical protein
MHRLTIAALLALASLASAQDCGVLAITGSGASGTSLQVDVSGATANGFALIVVGETLGSTSVPLPLGGSLSLGLATPYFPIPVGVVDAAGAATLSVPIPDLMGYQISLNAQAVVISIAIPFGLNACASNVVGFTIG